MTQVYAAQLTASRSGTVRYEKWLAGFVKQAVSPGATSERVSVSFNATNLGYDVVDMRRGGAHGWRVDPGEYQLFFCFSECDCPLNATMTVVE
jgi:hypothetical protein